MNAVVIGLEPRQPDDAPARAMVSCIYCQWTFQMSGRDPIEVIRIADTQLTIHIAIQHADQQLRYES